MEPALSAAPQWLAGHLFLPSAPSPLVPFDLFAPRVQVVGGGYKEFSEVWSYLRSARSDHLHLSHARARPLRTNRVVAAAQIPPHSAAMGFLAREPFGGGGGGSIIKQT